MAMTQDALDRTMARLEGLHATLAADEQEVLHAILGQAAGGDEVSGFMPSTSDIRTITINAAGAGAAAGPWDFAAVLQVPPASTRVGDVDGDGRADIITGGF